MTQPAFLLLLRKCLRRIRKMAAKPDRLSRDRRALHLFRVALKRWRAQLRLLRAADPAFPYAELYEPFKSVFAAAGNIRFWQLQAALLEDTPARPRPFGAFYHAWIRQQERKARKAFRQALRKADLSRWRELEAELRQSAITLTPATLRAYFRRLRDAANAHRPGRGRVAGAALHELRKILKEYGINRQYAVRCGISDPGAALPGLPLDSAAADELLGRWHDQAAAGVQLAADLRQEDWPADMRAGGRRLAAAWKRREKVLLQEVKCVFRK